MKIVYISGVGRSGTTVMDIVLGDNDHTRSFGEITQLYRKKLIASEDRRCSCGKPYSHCDFWQKINHEFYNAIGEKGVNEYSYLLRFFESQTKLKPKVYWAINKRKENYKKYIQYKLELFKAIQKISKIPIIVDSSKNPTIAYGLIKSGLFDVHVIHLIRDGRAVIWSNKKNIKKDVKSGITRDSRYLPAWLTTLRWIFTNIECEWLRRVSDRNRYIRIRYEDFVNAPEVILHQVEKLLNLDFTGTIKNLNNKKPLPILCNAGGNRLRMKNGLVLRNDQEWLVKLSRKDKKIFWFLSFWFSKRYGYKYEK